MFDFGVQLSLFSTFNSNLMIRYERIIAVGLVGIFLIYCVVLYRSYKRKMNGASYVNLDEY